jgi:two-component system sensor histidine kinase/response regulator
MNNLLTDKNHRVLVVDDNPSIHEDFRKILSPATAKAADLDATEAALFGPSPDAVEQPQFEVDSAYQGQGGVELAKKALEAGRPYAMAFVDVRMPPGWDGVETTRKIWELDPNLQVVLCTAYSDYSWSEMFEKLGQRDGLLILKKPFDAVEALQLAHALTEKWWLHQQSRRRMEELESRVAERTAELTITNEALQTENTARRQTEAERDRLIQDLQRSLANVKSLSGLLPICAGCKKIRDDQGYWSQVESYVQKHSEATFTHGLCPDCIKKYYPDLDDAGPDDSPKGTN